MRACIANRFSQPKALFWVTTGVAVLACFFVSASQAQTVTSARTADRPPMQQAALPSPQPLHLRALDADTMTQVQGIAQLVLAARKKVDPAPELGGVAQHVKALQDALELSTQRPGVASIVLGGAAATANAVQATDRMAPARARLSRLPKMDTAQANHPSTLKLQALQEKLETHLNSAALGKSTDLLDLRSRLQSRHDFDPGDEGVGGGGLARHSPSFRLRDADVSAAERTGTLAPATPASRTPTPRTPAASK
jgi:hypothetical protein